MNDMILSACEFMAFRNKRIAEQYCAGTPVAQMAKEFGIAEATVRAIATHLNARRPRKPIISKPPRVHVTKERNSERDKGICEDYLSGLTLQAVGDKHGITRERVRQILDKQGIEERHDGFMAPKRVECRIRSAETAERQRAKLERRHNERTKAREFYNAGETYEAIAERMSRSIAWVQKAVWVTGGPNKCRSAGEPKRRLSEAEKIAIGNQYAAGLPVREIAAQFDISPASVPTIANNAGFYRGRACQ